MQRPLVEKAKELRMSTPHDVRIDYIEKENNKQNDKIEKLEECQKEQHIQIELIRQRAELQSTKE